MSRVFGMVVLLCALVACVCASAVSAASCNLGGISVPDVSYPPQTSASYTYFFNPCGKKAAGTGSCASSNGPFLQGGASSCYVLGRDIEGIIADEKTMTITYELANGDPRSNNDLRRGLVSIQCGTTGPSIVSVSEDTLTSTYNIKVNAAGCTVGGGGDDGDGGSGGLSGGDIFLIIFFVGFALYFAVGIAICAGCMKKRGCEMVPNSSFWTGLPSLLWDGIKFAFCCGRKAEYNRV